MSKVVKNQPKSSSNASWKTSKLSKPEHVVRIGTLFSGIGAAEHALKRLKVKSEIVFAGDIDPHVKASYFANYGITEDRWHDDVHNFNAKPYKDKVDIVIGGAPCQAFSMVGKRGGLADTRGTLFHEFARVIRECQPKVFIFENVRGLLSHDNGNTWDVIQKKFKKLGYYFGL